MSTDNTGVPQQPSDAERPQGQQHQDQAPQDQGDATARQEATPAHPAEEAAHPTQRIPRPGATAADAAEAVSGTGSTCAPETVCATGAV
jgi:hypothetical protein